MKYKIHQKKIEDLSNTVYIYSVDIIGFAKSLREKSYNNKLITTIVNNTGKLSVDLLDTVDIIDDKKISESFKNLIKLAEKNIKKSSKN